MRNISMVLKRIMLYPLIALVTIMQYVAIFVSSIAAGFTDFLAAVIVVIGIVLCITKVVSGAEMVLMMIAAFAVFMIPFAGQMLVTVLERLRGKMLTNMKQTR